MNNDKSILHVLYEYSKIFAKGYNRKKFIIKVSEFEIFARNNSKNTYFSIIATFLSLGLFFTGIIEICTNQTEISFPFIIIFFIIHPAIGLIGFRHFLWLIRGWHEMKIINGRIILKNNGTILNKSKEYLISDINDLELLISDNDTLFEKIMYNIGLNHKLLFRQTFGILALTCKKKKIKVFSDLTVEEAEKLISSINSFLNLSPAAASLSSNGYR